MTFFTVDETSADEEKQEPVERRSADRPWSENKASKSPNSNEMLECMPTEQLGEPELKWSEF